MKSMVLLSSSDLIGVLILNADRLTFQGFAGSTEVSIFYAATLIGKVISLISTPLNGVIIGHLARYNNKLSSVLFIKICSLGIFMGILMDGVCVGVSHIFVRLLYPDIYDIAAPYFILANAGAIFYFVSNVLVVILLRFTSEKLQLHINLIYLFIFLVVSIPATAIWKLWGMAWSLTLVNLAKIIVIMILGKIQLDKRKS